MFKGLPAAADNGNVAWLVSDVKVLPAEGLEKLIVSGDKITNIILKEGFEWQTITGRETANRYTLTVEPTEHGVLYTNTLTLETIKLLPTALGWLARYAEVPMLFLAKEINGFTRLVGLPAEPMVLTGSGGSAAFFWEYSGTSTHPGFIVMDGLAEYEFSLEFSVEFNS